VPISKSNSYAEETPPASVPDGDAPPAWPGHAPAERAAVNDMPVTSTVKAEHMLALVAAALAGAGIIMALLYAVATLRRRSPSRGWTTAANSARTPMRPFDSVGRLPDETARKAIPQRRVAEDEPRDLKQELALRLEDLAIRRAAIARRQGA
jgi:hypothetical protein